MSDAYELVNYKGVDRPEYMLRNGRPLNIFGAKKILESQMEQIDTLRKALSDIAECGFIPHHSKIIVDIALETTEPEL